MLGAISSSFFTRPKPQPPVAPPPSPAAAPPQAAQTNPAAPVAQAAPAEPAPQPVAAAQQQAPAQETAAPAPSLLDLADRAAARPATTPAPTSGAGSAPTARAAQPKDAPAETASRSLLGMGGTDDTDAARKAAFVTQEILKLEAMFASLKAETIDDRLFAHKTDDDKASTDMQTARKAYDEAIDTAA